MTRSPSKARFVLLTVMFSATPTPHSGFVDRNFKAGRVIDTYQLYMEWTSPWGKTRFGRTPAGAWGTKFLDNSAQGNRLMWWLNMLPENWGCCSSPRKLPSRMQLRTCL